MAGTLPTENASHLTRSDLGYDAVFGVTQEAVNEILKTFLQDQSKFEPVIICFFYETVNGQAVVKAHSIEETIARLGFDPLLTLNNGQTLAYSAAFNPADPNYDPNHPILKLVTQGFAGGLLFQIGLPDGDVPDVVKFSNNPGLTKFRLLTSQMKVVDYKSAADGYQIQKYDQFNTRPEDIIFFEANVNLTSVKMELSDFDDLDPTVQDIITTQHGSLSDETFSVQQLLIDLTNLFMTSEPTIPGFTGNSLIQGIVNAQFAGNYFDTYMANGTPILNIDVHYTSVPADSLKITTSQIYINPIINNLGNVISNPTETQNLARTLNYLCAVDGHPLPAAKDMPWNWIAPDILPHPASGVLSINRNIFRSNLESRLRSHFMKFCIVPEVDVKVSGFLNTDVEFKYSQTTTEPVIERPDSGSTVLRITHHAKDYDDINITESDPEFGVEVDYTLTASFDGDAIKIDQTFTVDVEVQRDLGPKHHDHQKIVDRVYQDIYDLSVTANGALTATRSPSSAEPTINDKSLSLGSFLSDGGRIEDFVDDIKNDLILRDQATLAVNPVEGLRSFVFPGGQVFAFKAPHFSEHQDLVSQITYATPSSRVAKATSEAATRLFKSNLAKKKAEGRVQLASKAQIEKMKGVAEARARFSNLQD